MAGSGLGRDDGALKHALSFFRLHLRGGALVQFPYLATGCGV